MEKFKKSEDKLNVSDSPKVYIFFMKKHWYFFIVRELVNAQVRFHGITGPLSKHVFCMISQYFHLIGQSSISNVRKRIKNVCFQYNLFVRYSSIGLPPPSKWEGYLMFLTHKWSMFLKSPCLKYHLDKSWESPDLIGGPMGGGWISRVNLCLWPLLLVW